MDNGRASDTGGPNQKNQIGKALMNPIKRIPHRTALSALILASSLFAPKLWAPPFVHSDITPLGGGLYEYDFSILNTGPEDIVLVTITDAPLGDPLIAGSLVTPPGFLSSYDSGLGFVDFIANVD